MNKTTVHHIVGIDGITLIVFVAEAHCWQFRLISPGGAVFGNARFTTALKLRLRQGWSGLLKAIKKCEIQEIRQPL